MAQSYKVLKEEFVSNLSGGGILEINQVVAVASVGKIIFPQAALFADQFDSLPFCSGQCCKQSEISSPIMDCPNSWLTFCSILPVYYLP